MIWATTSKSMAANTCEQSTTRRFEYHGIRKKNLVLKLCCFYKKYIQELSMNGMKLRHELETFPPVTRACEEYRGFNLKSAADIYGFVFDSCANSSNSKLALL